MLYDNLVGLAADGAFSRSTGIARDWSHNDDATVWRFDLRPGIQFHDGNDLTAEDVQWSLERYASDEATTAGSWREVLDHVEVVTTLGVRLHLLRPEPNLELFLATEAGRIMSKRYFEAVGPERFSEAPVGSGPYKLLDFRALRGGDRLVMRRIGLGPREGQLQRWTEGNRVRLEAVDNHWLVGKPKYKEVNLTVIYRSEDRLALLREGHLDYAILDDESMREAEGGEGAEVLYGAPPTRALAILFHEQFTDGSPQADPRVRRALALAIDNHAVLEFSFAGRAIPSGSIFGRPRRVDVPPPQYDPKQAKALLTAAGYPEGFEVVAYALDDDDEIIMHLVSEYWRTIGLEVTLVRISPSVYYAEWRDHELTRGTARGVAVALMTGDGRFATSGTHVRGYGEILHSQQATLEVVDDPDLDRIIEAAQSARTLEEYEGLMEEAGARALDQMAVIPLGEIPVELAVNPKGIRENFDLSAGYDLLRRLVGQGSR